MLAFSFSSGIESYYYIVAEVDKRKSSSPHSGLYSRFPTDCSDASSNSILDSSELISFNYRLRYMQSHLQTYMQARILVHVSY